MGLKVFFLEIVHPHLDSGKVWGFSIVSFCTPPFEISGLPFLNTESDNFSVKYSKEKACEKRERVSNIEKMLQT